VNVDGPQNAAAGPSKRAEISTVPVPPPDTPSTVFAGLRFLLLRETDTATVRGAIEEAGGAVDNQAGKVDADYIVVRLVRCAP
jgi:hypothetical protein